MEEEQVAWSCTSILVCRTSMIKYVIVRYADNTGSESGNVMSRLGPKEVAMVKDYRIMRQRVHAILFLKEDEEEEERKLGRPLNDSVERLLDEYPELLNMCVWKQRRKAKNMEMEISKLQKKLEDQNCQLEASTSASDGDDALL